MIMTTGAFQRESKKGRANGIDGFRTPFGPIEVTVVGVLDRKRP